MGLVIVVPSPHRFGFEFEKAGWFAGFDMTVRKLNIEHALMSSIEFCQGSVHNSSLKARCAARPYLMSLLRGTYRTVKCLGLARHNRKFAVVKSVGVEFPSLEILRRFDVHGPTFLLE